MVNTYNRVSSCAKSLVESTTHISCGFIKALGVTYSAYVHYEQKVQSSTPKTHCATTIFDDMLFAIVVAHEIEKRGGNFSEDDLTALAITQRCRSSLS